MIRQEWEKQMIAKTAKMTDQEKQESWDRAREILRDGLARIAQATKRKKDGKICNNSIQ